MMPCSHRVWAKCGQARHPIAPIHRKNPAITGMYGARSGGLIANLPSRANAGNFSSREKFILSKFLKNPLGLKALH